MQKSSRQSNDGAKLQTPPRRPISLQSPKPIVQALSPSPPTFLRKRRRPRSCAGGESLSTSLKPASLRPDPGYLRGELRSPESNPAYRRRYAVCALGLSCRHRTLWSPLFRRLDTLAIDNGCTGAGLTPLSLAKLVSQGIVNLLPGAVLAPCPEVAIHRLVGREVLGKHPPSNTPAAHIEDGIDDIPQRGSLRAPSGLGSREERGNDIPFGIRDIAWVTHGRYFSIDTGNFRDTLLVLLCHKLS